MTVWYRLRMLSWCPTVVALALLGLPGASQAWTVGFFTGAQIPDDGSEEITIMNETVVPGLFVDPFDTEDSEPIYDPWEPFNATIFEFNHRADIYLLRPAAAVYNIVLPPDVQNSFGNVFYNTGFVARFFNNVLQGKFSESGRETQRFLLNSTLGVGGLFDVATHMFGIEAPPTEDTDQTLAVYGIPSGPYLIVPFLPPLTVRGAVGFVSDTVLDPVNYFVPMLPNLGLNAVERINDRSRTVQTFEGIETSSVDLYGAVRGGYWDRRSSDILE